MVKINNVISHTEYSELKNHNQPYKNKGKEHTQRLVTDSIDLTHSVYYEINQLKLKKKKKHRGRKSQTNLIRKIKDK